MKVRDLVKEFRDQCQAKIASKKFTPEDFKHSMAKNFLNRQLQTLILL